MTTDLPSPAAHQATSILRAWQAGNINRLSTELAHAANPPLPADCSCAEQERAELLQAIAAELRDHGAPSFRGGAERVEVCMGLLRHLVANHL